MNSKMAKVFFLTSALIGNLMAESLFKISGVSVGEPQCPEGRDRVIIQSGRLKLVDTVLADSSFLAIEKILPTRELEISGFVLCESSSRSLDELKITDPAQKRKIDLGGKVSVHLDSVYVGDRSSKRMSALDAELKFKKFLADERTKRLNLGKSR